jgi:tRNA A37 threonylcarbamoyladenosine dehydratase
LPDGTRTALERTVVVGSTRKVLTPALDPADATFDARYDRQTLLYGHAGQAILGTTKVVVVGVGGVGMLLVQLLARLGVGHIVVIDPDKVERSNLPRLPEATRLDAMEYLDRDGMPTVLRRLGRRLARPKVHIARRIVRRASPDATITAVIGDVADDYVARHLVDADFLFLAADTMLARDVVNQVAHQYLIPGLQVGSKITVDPTTGRVGDVFAVVRHLATTDGCFRCNGLVDPVRLTEQTVGDPEQVANQRYVDDPDVHAPSVITLNAVGAGWAANDFMLQSVGLPAAEPGYRIIRHRPRGRHGHHITVQEPDKIPGCHVCSVTEYAARARGDTWDLPTRVTALQR